MCKWPFTPPPNPTILEPGFTKLTNGLPPQPPISTFYPKLVIILKKSIMFPALPDISYILSPSCKVSVTLLRSLLRAHDPKCRTGYAVIPLDLYVISIPATTDSSVKNVILLISGTISPFYNHVI